VVAIHQKGYVMGSSSNGRQGAFGWQNQGVFEGDAGELGRALVVGVVGGLLSAAGYLVYRRLPDEQREKINGQARSMLQQRITDVREALNI
jgi:hypothetical protein